MVVVMRASLPVLLHVEGGCSVPQIGDLIGASPTAVRQWLIEDGCEVRPGRFWRASRARVADANRLRREGMSVGAACQQAGLATVY